MEKSLGNKRRRIGDPSDEKTKKDPNHIGEITKIFGDFRDGDARTFTEEDTLTHQPIQRPQVINHARRGVDGTHHRNRKHIVMTVTIRIGAFAINVSVLLRRQGIIVETVRSRKPVATRQADHQAPP